MSDSTAGLSLLLRSIAEEAAAIALSKSGPGAKRLLSAEQASEYLGYGLSHFRTLDLPAVGEGRATRYDIKDLDAWIARNKR